MSLFDNIPEGTDIIEVRKKVNKMLSEARKKAKPPKCILCGKEQSSFCNSHSVPQMCLRPIADRGKVLHARCLHDQDEDEKAKAQYLKCINIWSEMSEDGNRKLALAHQEIADIFFSENNAADALEHYVLAEKFNAEDFYVEVDVLDSVAACLLLLDKPEEGIQKFKELLEILVKYKANDTEAKFQLCNNLFCIIDAESEEEIELREMLMEQIKDEPATVEYVHNFLTNREEK